MRRERAGGVERPPRERTGRSTAPTASSATRGETFEELKARALAAALLEQATALDWMSRYAGSDERARAAAPIVYRLDDPVLSARYAMARGRSALRLARAAEAVPWLVAGAEGAAAAADYDARVVSLLLLGPALVQIGCTGEAAVRFEEVIALCEQAGDALHLCAALGNRVALWSALRDTSRARADLEQARRLARAAGHAVPERNMTYNLAEYLYWGGGRDREALGLAERARVLQERLVGPAVEDAVLCARIRLSLGDAGGAGAEISRAQTAAPRAIWPPAVALLARMVELSSSPPHDESSWDALESAGEPVLSADERVELAYWRARATGQAQAALRARQLAREAPVWAARVASLG